MIPNGFFKLTTTHNTPMVIRRDAVLVIEGYTYGADHSTHPNHEGSRITLQNGQWSETVYAVETMEQAVAAFGGFSIDDTDRQVPPMDIYTVVGSARIGISAQNELVAFNDTMFVSFGKATDACMSMLADTIHRLSIHATDA